MPGYVIHLAIAQEYLKKHNKAYNINFIYGNIDPDLTEDKSKTHYGKSPSYVDLGKFLSENELDTEYNQGFFLHLVSDYLFYNKYLEILEKPQIYFDYDYTNKSIIDKYKVILPEKIKNKIFFKKGIPKNFTFKFACKIIDEISNLDLNQIKQEIDEKNIKWYKYKKLV